MGPLTACQRCNRKHEGECYDIVLGATDDRPNTRRRMYAYGDVTPGRGQQWTYLETPDEQRERHIEQALKGEFDG